MHVRRDVRGALGLRLYGLVDPVRARLYVPSFMQVQPHHIKFCCSHVFLRGRAGAVVVACHWQAVYSTEP